MDYTIDAKGKILGRLASEISLILQGKKNPAYNPRLIGGDRVLLKNYKDFSFTNKKLLGKVYYRHTGYMGHLRSKTLSQVLERDPRQAVREAVRKMLPKNSLNPRRLKNLIFIEE